MPHVTLLYVELFGQKNWTCLFSALIDDSDRVFSRIPEYFTSDHAKYFDRSPTVDRQERRSDLQYRGGSSYGDGTRRMRDKKREVRVAVWNTSISKQFLTIREAVFR